MSSIKSYKIYKYTNLINGMSYIGQTTKSLEERARNKYQGTAYFGSAIEEYGLETFKSEILLEVHTKKNADFAEWLMTKVHNTQWPCGYNDNCGWKRSEEQKRKQSKAMKGRDSWNKGISCSEEHRQKQSKTMKQKYNNGYVSPRKGVHCSEETKRKLSEAHLGVVSHTKGKHCYTNGIKNIFAFECPEGFWLGRSLKNKVQNNPR